MYSVILKFDKFFLKYEGERGQIDPSPMEKVPSKSPALLGLSKSSLESHGLHVTVHKTKILFSSAEHNKISARNSKYSGGVFAFGAVANSIFST